MIMSTVSNATLQRDVYPAALSMRVAGAVRRWWIAYMKLRFHDMAVRQLQSMSDRELKDIGVSRAEIEIRVRDDDDRHPRLRRYY
jgi:uncharacterized protein YjiS (DUF1127 family)